MKRSFKSLLAAVALLAVMCAGAAFATDVTDLRMGKLGPLSSVSSGGGGDVQAGVGPVALPEGVLRLWVTRRNGFISEEKLELVDSKGSPLAVNAALYGASSRDVAPAVWLTARNAQSGFDYDASSGDIDGTNIRYKLDGNSYVRGEPMQNNKQITISADRAVSGDSVTIFFYGGMSSIISYNAQQSPIDETVPSVQVISSDEQGNKDYISIDSFPADLLASNDQGHNGAMITSFDVIVLSSDADLLLDQIDADTELRLRPGANIVEKDGEGTVVAVNENKRSLSASSVSTMNSSNDPLVVDLVHGVTEIVVVSADSQGGIGYTYVQDLDPRDAYAYLREGADHDPGEDATPIFKFRPVLDASGTITYRMDDPGMLAALKERFGSVPGETDVMHIDFDDLNSRYGWSLSAYSVKFAISAIGGGGGSSSSGCAAGAAALVGLAALVVIRRKK